MKKSLFAAVLAAFLLPLICMATEHDGKSQMETSVLSLCIQAGLQSAGYPITDDAVALLMETAAAESRLGHYDVPYKAKGSYGIFQITKSTAEDTLEWLKRSDWKIWQKVMEYVYDANHDMLWNLTNNVEFGAVLAWLVYRRMGGKSMDISNREKRAELWKRVYNTPLGAGTEETYLKRSAECLN